MVPSKITVGFVLADDQKKRVQRIAEVLGLDWEKCFVFLMTVGSRGLIDGRLDLIESLEPMRTALAGGEK